MRSWYLKPLFHLALATALIGPSYPAWAQASDCNEAVQELRAQNAELSSLMKPREELPELVTLEEEITRRIRGLLKQETEMKAQAATEVGRSKAVNLAQQLTAPSSVPTAGSVVGGPDFATLLGLAAENDLISQGDGLFTLNLSPFAVRALRHPEQITDQTEYQSPINRRLRRLGLKISSGGKGEKFDRDGDGQADDPLEAKEFDDILTWEIQWRFWGSRDVREQDNYRRLARAALGEDEGGKTILEELDDLVAEQVQWRAQHLAEIRQMEARAVDALFLEPGAAPTDEEARAIAKARTDLSGCVLGSESAEFFERAVVKETMAAFEARTKALEEGVDEQITKIENSDIWTLVISGVERKDDFGPDKQMAAIRGAHGGWNFNLEWSRSDALAEGMPEPEMWKLGVERSWKVLEGAFNKPGTLSFSGAYEIYDQVPDALHDQIAKAGAKLELPIREGLKIPISVTWANHEDLLTDEDEVRGHIGLSYDLSQLFQDNAAEVETLRIASKKDG